MDEKNDKFEAGVSSNAKKDPVRVVFVTKKTSAKVTGDAASQRMAFPHLLLREAIAFEVLVIALVLVALFWDAPLEQLANPLLTPNPAKAPWYFLGLQELLHYYPPVVAGILIPTLVVVALIVIPYFKVNVQGEPLWAGNVQKRVRFFLIVFLVLLAFLALTRAWTVLAPTLAVGSLILYSYFADAEKQKWTAFLKSRPISWWVMTWFITVALVLTLVGTYFRGPGWSWVWPWRPHGG